MVLLTQDCYRLLQASLPFCLDFDDDNDDEGTLTGVDDRDDGSLSTSTRKGAHSHKTKHRNLHESILAYHIYLVTRWVFHLPNSQKI